MLELKNINKTYRPKHGKPVHALNDVSLKFDQKGMVFILGKSGCGKSTLLNVIGGLDKYDSGEIIIKGKSSKEFSGSDFDSYRNTFIGFIFQEYNILSEFNIAKNIALAIELQGKKATPEKVQELLDMVDLSSQGSRKTTELSCGQKQRVAIARALIKEPEIIIADEPTGALDSATGAQVFDTLKKLSKDKLVIIVSHDREYAEIYADRIIEMKDGVVISDETKRYIAPKPMSNSVEVIGDNIIRIAPNHKVSSEDLQKIEKILNCTNEEKIISFGTKNNEKFKKINKISDNGHTEVFNKTRPDDFDNIEYDKKKLKFIKSKLRFKDSFKMGASGLKTKPIRLFVTILLSLVAFTLFGLADTMASYNKTTTTVQSFIDSDYKTIMYVGEKRRTYSYTNSDGEEQVQYSYSSSKMKQNNLDLLASKTNTTIKPVFTFKYNSSSLNYCLSDPNAVTKGTLNGSYFSDELGGFIELSEEELSDFGCTVVAGRLPANNAFAEIAVPKYFYELFEVCGIKQRKLSDRIENLFIYKYEDLNANGEIELNELTKINTSSYPYYNYTKTQFFESGTYYATKNIEKENANQDDFILLTDENLSWEDGVTLGPNTYNILLVYLEEIDKSSENVNSYNDILGIKVCFDDTYYSDSDKKYYTIVGVVDTGLDATPYLSMKTDAINKTTSNSTSQAEYLKRTKFASLLQNGLHQLAIVSPGFINANSEKYFSLSFSDSDTVFYYNARVHDGGEYREEIRTLWFNNAINFSPTDTLFVPGKEGTTKLNSNQFVVDFSVAVEGIERAYYKMANEDSSFRYTDEYHTFENYINRLNNLNTANVLIASDEFREWILANHDKWDINIGKYPNRNNHDYASIVGDSTKEVIGLYMHEYTNKVNYNSWEYVLIGSDDFLDLYTDGAFTRAFGIMPTSKDDLLTLVSDYYKDQEDTSLLFRFSIQNSVISSLDMVNSFIEGASKAFLYVGIGFAAFSGLMLANFISVSITYKKREIGILRAIGARKKDVFSIFYNESLIVATINFVLSIVSTFAVCMIINSTLRNNAGIEITILVCGIRQVILLAAVSLLVAILASAIPVFKIARKQPIDAINNR